MWNKNSNLSLLTLISSVLPDNGKCVFPRKCENFFMGILMIIVDPGQFHWSLIFVDCINKLIINNHLSQKISIENIHIGIITAFKLYIRNRKRNMLYIFILRWFELKFIIAIVNLKNECLLLDIDFLYFLKRSFLIYHYTFLFLKYQCQQKLRTFLFPKYAR